MLRVVSVVEQRLRAVIEVLEDTGTYRSLELNRARWIPYDPDVRGVKGEAGESPALSRNCKPMAKSSRRAGYPPLRRSRSLREKGEERYG